MQNFGEYLKQLRNDCGLSLYKLYEKTGITDSRLSKAENGAWCNLKLSEIRKLAETSASQSNSISQLLQSITEAISGIVESSDKSSKNFASVGEKIKHLQQLIDEHLLCLRFAFIGNDHRIAEQLLCELLHRFRALLDCIQTAGDLGRIVRPADHIEIAGDRRQRRAEIMRDIRDGIFELCIAVLIL